MKKKKAKLTFRRRVVMLGVDKDFGLGPGVVYQDEITFTSKDGRGFDSPMFAVEFMASKEKLVEKLFRVEMEEVTDDNKGKKK